MGGAELFGKTLKKNVENIIAQNQMTPAVAFQELQKVQQQMTAFVAALDQTIAAFQQFKIGSEQLAPGEAEITVLIPRQAGKDNLGDFADELHELEFILNTFAQVSTNEKEDLKIRTVSSSDLLVYLAASPLFAACLARAVGEIVGLYKKLLEVRKLSLEIDRLEMPEISEQMKKRANKVMSDGIEQLTVRIINEFHKGKDSERKNELTNSVRVSLNRIANRIDKGFNIEVRVEPSKAPAGPNGDKIKKAEAIVQAAAPNMQYLKLEGPPMLSLPENSESAGAKPDTKASRRARGRTTPKEAKPAPNGDKTSE